MADLDALKEKAQQVRNEVQIGANTASKVGYILEEIVKALQIISNNAGLSSEGKEAIVACFRKCAWVDTTGAALVNRLISALGDGGSGDGGSDDDSGISISDYVQDGLLLWYDAIQNTRSGHAAQTSVWEDLVGTGDYDLQIYSDVTASQSKTITCGENYVPLDGETLLAIKTDTTFSPFLASESGTLEIVFKQETEETGIFLIARATDEQAEFTKCFWYRQGSGGYVYQSAATGDGEAIVTDIPSGVSSFSKIYPGDARLNDSSVTNIASGGNMPAYGMFTVGGRYHISSENPGYFMVGKIMAIRYYNRCLTDAERTLNYTLDKARFGVIEDNSGGSSGDSSGDASTEDYITDGLVFWFDGINNTSSGHSDNITGWADLTGNGWDLTAYGDIGATTIKSISCGSNYIPFDGSTVMIPEGKSGSDASIMDATIRGTLEVVLEQETEEASIVIGSFAIGEETGNVKGLWYRPASNGYVHEYMTTGSGVGHQTGMATSPTQFSRVYNGGDFRMNNTAGYTEVSGGNMVIYSAISVGGRTHSNTANVPYFFTGKIYAIRYYSRALTDTERAHNFALDKTRFVIV